MLPDTTLEKLDRYKQTTDNQLKIELLPELLKELARYDRKQTIDLCAEGIVIALKENNKSALGDLYNTMGKQVYATGDYNGAMEYFFMALRMRRETKDEIGVGIMLNNIGSINNTLENLEQAAKYHQQAIEIFEQHQYERGLTMSYNNLGNVLIQQGDSKAALSEYLKSLKIKEQLNDMRGLSILYNNLGLTYLELKEYNKALESQHNSLKLKRELGDKWGIPNTLANIVEIYFKMEDYSQAISFAKDEIEAYDSIDDTKGVVGALIEVGQGHFHLKDFELSLEYFQQALDKASEEFHDDLALIHEGMGYCYHQNGTYEKAHEHYKLAFSEMRKHQEDIVKNAHRDMTRKIEANYEIRLKEQETELLERSNEALEQFSYVVSHDLKEPLRTVNSFLGALDTKLKGKLAPDEKQLLDFALDGGQRMTSLIDEFLNFAKMQKDSSRFKVEPLENIIGAAESQLALKLQETQGTITKEVDGVELYCDPGQLVQLFQNLFSNSLKFTKPGVSPLIEVTAHEEDRHYKVAVKDNGIGIDEAYQGRVFEIMQRVHSKRDYEGHGIGLSTCRKIVEHHGGKIWLESIVGKGTTFYIKLPKLQLNTSL